MDSSSGVSSNSSGLQNSGSEEDLQQILDLRKKKRMISNRESARRSRLRKQKHLEEVMAQVAWLRKENRQILNGLNVTSAQFMSVESENAILKAQLAELSYRLESLKEIVSFISSVNGGFQEEPDYDVAGLINTSWNCFSQPIVMAAAATATVSADVGFLY